MVESVFIFKNNKKYLLSFLQYYVGMVEIQVYMSLNIVKSNQFWTLCDVLRDVRSRSSIINLNLSVNLKL